MGWKTSTTTQQKMYCLSRTQVPTENLMTSAKQNTGISWLKKKSTKIKATLKLLCKLRADFHSCLFSFLCLSNPKQRHYQFSQDGSPKAGQLLSDKVSSLATELTGDLICSRSLYLRAREARPGFGSGKARL